MAMKWLPAFSAPTACLTRSKKYCLKMFGSKVVPDLLETTNRVLPRFTLSSKALTCAGSVESRTCSSGKPEIGPKVIFNTSGQRLEPPMPNRRRSVKPSFFTASTTARIFWLWAFCSSVTSSQPSQLASSVLVQREASRCHKRRTFPAARHSSILAFTGAAKDWGNL